MPSASPYFLAQIAPRPRKKCLMSLLVHMPLPARSPHRQAKASEETLLEMLPGAPVRRNASSGRAPDVLENKTEANESLRGQIIQNQTIGKRDRVPTPASPFLLSRSHMSIELLPAPFPVPHAGQSTNFGVRNERRADDARKVIASNATSSKTISSRTERPTDYPKIVKVGDE